MIEYTSNNHLTEKWWWWQRNNLNGPFSIFVQNDPSSEEDCVVAMSSSHWMEIEAQENVWDNLSRTDFKTAVSELSRKKNGTISAYNTLEIPFDTFAKF